VAQMTLPAHVLRSSPPNASLLFTPHHHASVCNPSAYSLRIPFLTAIHQQSMCQRGAREATGAITASAVLFAQELSLRYIAY
jgi:hypothetical protein